MTVQGNIDLVMNRHTSDRAGRVNELLNLVGLADFKNAYPKVLSGGMAQRVSLARALANEPDVLLLDEPFSAVDALTRANLQQLVLELWQELKLTVLFVTHDVDEAVFLSTRVMALAGAPARVDLDVPIDLAYPRDQVASREHREFIARRRELFLSITRQPARDAVAEAAG